MKDEKRRYSFFPKTLSQCVEPLTKPLFKERGLAGTRILTDWPQIVGKALSTRCWPEKLSFPQGKKTGGTLTVGVENGFALDVQYSQPVILERVNGFYGYQAITKLAINQAIQPKPRAKTPPPRPVKTHALPLDIVETVTDPELKKALQSLANSATGQ